MIRRIYRATACTTLLASTVILAGCISGNTYGTGVSQEAQLLSDISNIVPLGTPERKQPIDYSSRPKLVQAPADDALPPPAEKASGSESVYFPTNPEERQAALNNTRKKPFTRRDGGIDYTIPEDVDAPSASGDSVYEPWRGRADDGTGDREPSAAEMASRSIEGKKERLKRMKEISGSAVLGTGPRKYLTQPPEEYRTPAETAPVGETGEYEYGEKERKSIFSIFGNGRNTREDINRTLTPGSKKSS